MTRSATEQQRPGTWSWLGYLLAIQFAAMVAVAVLYRRRRQVLWPARRPGGVLGLHLPGQPGDRELDRSAGRLAGAAPAVGVFPPRRRRAAGSRHGEPDRCRAPLQRWSLNGRGCGFFAFHNPKPKRAACARRRPNVGFSALPRRDIVRDAPRGAWRQEGFSTALGG